MPDRSRIASDLLRYLPQRPPHPALAFVIGAGWGLAGLALRLAIDPFVEGVPFLTFFPMLIVSGLSGGTVAGITTLLIGAAAGIILWMPPPGSLDVDARGISTALAFMASGGAILFMTYIIQELVAVLRRSERRYQLVAGEMQHRLKNLLQLVQSVSAISARTATTVAEHQASFQGRINSLSAGLDATAGRVELPVEMHALLVRLLAPFDTSRIGMSGAAVTVQSEVASTLSLVIHELATNAVKYGALSVPNGKVQLSWHVDGQFAILEWREHSGPPVEAPDRLGFGSRLLKAAFRDAGGSATVEYRPEGVLCTVRFVTPPPG